MSERLVLSNITPHAIGSFRFCWDCEQRFPLAELAEVQHESGLTCWRCPACQEGISHV